MLLLTHTSHVLTFNPSPMTYRKIVISQVEVPKTYSDPSFHLHYESNATHSLLYLCLSIVVGK